MTDTPTARLAALLDEWDEQDACADYHLNEGATARLADWLLAHGVTLPEAGRETEKPHYFCPHGERTDCLECWNERNAQLGRSLPPALPREPSEAARSWRDIVQRGSY